MNGPEQVAELYLNKARQDLSAAQHLAQSPAIADEVIGFHIQQAIEKALKAVLVRHRVAFRKTHDIRELLDLLPDETVELPGAFRDLDDWTAYGVELRYDDIPVGIPPVDRAAALRLVEDFLRWAADTGASK